MSNETKSKFTWRDGLYITAFVIGLGTTIITFSVRFALLEATVQVYEEERKLYNLAVFAKDIEYIKDDVEEIKDLVKAMQ